MKAKRKTIFTRFGTIMGVFFLVFGGAMLLPVRTLEAKDEVNFVFDWKIAGYHAPLLLALERGYFAAEGIDAKFTEGMGSATIVKIIAEGKTNPIGYPDFGTMAKAVVQGVPVKAIFSVHQTSPLIIISHAENPIRSPKELEGKVVAMEPASSTMQIFYAVVAASGIDINKINIMTPAVGAKLALFLQNRCDAFAGYLNNQVPHLEAQGVKVHYFRYADFGANTLCNGIAGSTRFISENKDLVKRYIRAMAKGFKDAQKDPEAAVEAVFKTYPQYRDIKDILVKQLKLTLPLMESPNTKGKPMGWMSEKDWEQTQEILATYADLKKKIDVKNYFTNEFIPE